MTAKYACPQVDIPLNRGFITLANIFPFTEDATTSQSNIFSFHLNEKFHLFLKYSQASLQYLAARCSSRFSEFHRPFSHGRQSIDAFDVRYTAC